MSADADTTTVFAPASYPSPKAEIEVALTKAMMAAGLPNTDPVIRSATQPQFGDFQVNGLLAVARTVKRPPRSLAQSVLDQLQWHDFAQKVEVAGPGYLNIFLRYDYLCRYLNDDLAPALAHLPDSVSAPGQPSGFNDGKRVVVDMSSPNLAKEMHVGHLRSTILGDAIARILACFGHQVIRQNHVGDWGTHFGMLIAYMQDQDLDEDSALSDLEEAYRQARQRFDTDESFAQVARETVVRLQSGDEDCLSRWRQFRERTLALCDEIYTRLNVNLKPEDVRGESDYNDQLAGVMEALEQAGLIQYSEGARCVFLDDIKNKEGRPLPLIVQKSDGGYLYATTDLAAVRYRSEVLQADALLYCVDARQSLHFQQIFKVARLAGFVKSNTVLRHLSFGMVMGQDSKPLKTRDGDIVRLQALLDEAEKRAQALVRERSASFSTDELKEIARVVGIGAVKYADLSRNRTSSYVFDWDAMLSLEGNTAAYLQYAYARIQSLMRKVPTVKTVTAPSVEESQAQALALHLSLFFEVLVDTAELGQPHLLCTYLYELATRFSAFYEHCSVLQAASDDLRGQRLELCRLTGETLKRGLALLGIEVLNEM